MNVSGQSSSTLTVQSESVYGQLYNALFGATRLCLTFIFSPVPQPGVDVTLSRTAPLCAGTGLTLTFTMTLDPNVDNGESVMIEWSGLQDIPEE